MTVGVLSVLTTDDATAQVMKLIVDSGYHSEISRVFSHLANHLPDHVATVVLVRAGGRPAVIGRVLEEGLPHTASISIFRQKRYDG